MMITTDLAIQVEIEGKLVGPMEPTYHAGFGNWLPGSPAEVIGMRVYMHTPSGRLDITAQLDPDYLAELEQVFIEYHTQEETNAV